jgi:hypothetical protein
MLNKANSIEIEQSLKRGSNCKMAVRFQFNLRHMLLAMFWFSICGLGVATILRFWPREPFSNASGWLNIAFYWFAAFLVIWSPCVAIGALFGYTKRGMVVGIAVFVACFVILSLLAALLVGPKFM